MNEHLRLLHFPNITALGVIAAVNSTLTCEYIPLRDKTTKFVLLIVVTPALCIFGAFGNTVSIKVYVRRSMRSTNNVLLAALAVCDLAVITSAILLYTVEVAYDLYSDENLFVAWMTYLKEMYFISHVAQTSAVYMTVAATVERWIATGYPGWNYKFCRVNTAWVTISVVFFWSLCVNATKYWEIDIVDLPWCLDTFATLMPMPSKFAENPTYKVVYTLWLSNILVVILPFVLLSVLNIVILNRIRYRTSGGSPKMMIQQAVHVPVLNDTDRDRSRFAFRVKRKEATQVLIVVVLVFLVCNAPGFFLTIIERFDMQFLQRHPRLYGYAKDVTNLLAICNSCANFLVYVLFGRDFRRELRRIVKRRRKRRRFSMTNNNGLILDEHDGSAFSHPFTVNDNSIQMIDAQSVAAASGLHMT